MGTKVAAVTMVKNEQDIIRYTVANMLEQVDFVIVADNMSRDNTRPILESIAAQNERLIIVDDLDPAHEQSRKMTALAFAAGDRGAEWVIPFDADEYWQCTTPLPIGQMIQETQFDIYVSTLYDYMPTALDNDDLDPCHRIKWRVKEPNTLKKVAVRVRDGLVIAEGNHSASYIDFMPTYNVNDLEVRHFPWRTKEQFVNKAVQGAVALEKTNLPYEIGQHWRDYKALADANGPVALEDVFLQHFYSNNPYDNNDLVYDPI